MFTTSRAVFPGTACRLDVCWRQLPAISTMRPAAAPKHPPAAAAGRQPAPKNEIPAAELSAVMAAISGAGFMEQYEYGKAAKAFREVRRRAPGWIPGAINLAIALLNMTGEEVEAAEAKPEGVPRWATSTKPFSSLPGCWSGSRITRMRISVRGSSSSSRATWRKPTSISSA